MNLANQTITGPEGPIPILAAWTGEDAGQPAVILCHGLGVSKETNLPELERLAEAGFFAVGLDAPSHGKRADGRAEALHDLEPQARHEAFIDLVRRAVEEIPWVVRALIGTGASGVGMVGISMGGYTAFGACLREPRPSAVVPMIASPDFRYRAGPGGLPAPGFADSPHRHPDRFFPTALQVVTAGRDAVVPPQPASAFVEELRPFYSGRPALLSARCFPESEHFLRPPDWDSAWDGILPWLARYINLPVSGR